MSFFHQARKWLNRLLAPVGLTVNRTEKTGWPWSDSIVTAQVGRFSIQVPRINPIATHYERYPDYTGHLGRLAALLKNKYPGLVAMDIGANVGDTACIIKSAADIPLLCIEGDDFTFGFLEKNIRQFSATTAHKMFLGERTESMEVSLDKSGWNTTLKPEKSDSAQTIKITSLDDFLPAQPGMKAIKLVKIDTEGFDCSIIRGAKKFIQQVHPVITFEYNRDNMAALGEKGLDTLALLASLGYSQIVFHDCDGRFFSTADLSDEEFIRDIHDYADGRNALVYYFDLTLFHESDKDVAAAFAQAERKWRLG